MFKFSKRQLITGIVGIAVCGGLMALFITLDRGGAITEIPPEQVVFRIVSLLLMSGAVGCCSNCWRATSAKAKRCWICFPAL